MDVARLVLDFINVLIWPIVVTIAILLFRSHLGAIFARLKSASLPGIISIDLSDDIKEAKEISQEVPKSTPPEGKENIPTIPLNEANARMLSLGLRPSPSGLNIEYYRELAKQDPNLALAGIRMELELTGVNLAKGFGIDVTHKRSTEAIYRSLIDAGAITGDQYDLARKIIHVCNAAIHGNPISRAEANDVIDVATVLAGLYVDWLSWGFPEDWVSF